MSGSESDQEEETDSIQKKNRTSWKQRMLLESIFQTDPYPNFQLRTELGKKLSMNPRKVQIWFQNRRMKEKTLKETESHKLTLLSHAVDNTTLNMKQNYTGNNLLLIAISMDHPSVHNLLSKGADCNSTNNLGWTPLYAAVVNEYKHLVEILLSPKYKVDVNVKENRFGQSALHLACLKGRTEIVSVLLTMGSNIDVNIKDHEHFTPLHHACVYGFCDIVQLLLSRDANVNEKSKDGLTPLHAAAFNGSVEVVEKLIRAGADITVKDNFGFKPLDFAYREQNTEVLLLFHKVQEIS